MKKKEIHNCGNCYYTDKEICGEKLFDGELCSPTNRFRKYKPRETSEPTALANSQYVEKKSCDNCASRKAGCIGEKPCDYYSPISNKIGEYCNSCEYIDLTLQEYPCNECVTMKKQSKSNTNSQFPTQYKERQKAEKEIVVEIINTGNGCIIRVLKEIGFNWNDILKVGEIKKYKLVEVEK